MAILRAFWIVLVTPFLPKYGFGLYMDDRRPQLVRRIGFWFSFTLLMILFYWLIKLKPTAFTEFPFLDWITIFFLKFGGIILFFFIGGVSAVILKINENHLPFHMFTAVLALSIVPEFAFVGGIYFYPEYYQEIRFLSHVWRTVIIVLGIYYTEDTTMRKATICGSVAMLTIYFLNYNYFLPNDEGY